MLDRYTEYKRSFSVDGTRMAPQRRRSLNWALGNEQKLGMGGVVRGILGLPEQSEHRHRDKTGLEYEGETLVPLFVI